MGTDLDQTLNISVSSLSSTQALAKRLAGCLTSGDVLGFSGDLGAGKTTFIGFLAQCLVSKNEKIETSSPTFSKMNLYDTFPPVAHFDFYQFDEKATEWMSWVWEYCEPPYLALIEWIECVPEVEKIQDLHLNVNMQSLDSRSFHFKPFSRRGNELIEELKALNVNEAKELV